MLFRSWEAAIRKAGKAAEAAAEEAKKRKKPKRRRDEAWKKAMAELNGSVRGTFNVAAIQGLMGGDAMDRTADATEETAGNTKRMLDELKDQEGLAFS